MWLLMLCFVVEGNGLFFCEIIFPFDLVRPFNSATAAVLTVKISKRMVSGTNGVLIDLAPDFAYQHPMSPGKQAERSLFPLPVTISMQE